MTTLINFADDVSVTLGILTDEQEDDIRVFVERNYVKSGLWLPITGSDLWLLEQEIICREEEGITYTSSFFLDSSTGVLRERHPYLPTYWVYPSLSEYLSGCFSPLAVFSYENHLPHIEDEVNP